jgi:flagellar hook-length control protein FliK
MEQPQEQQQQQQQQQMKLTDIQITDENVALNVIVSFLTLAQKRGVYTLDESAKIWECIKKFQKS